MEDQNQQNSNPQQSQPLTQAADTSYISTSQPKKVLQPSTELVQEIKAEQAERAEAQAAQAATQSMTQQVIATAQLQQQQPIAPQPDSPVTGEATGSVQVVQTPAATDPIYPEPTKGVGGVSAEPSTPAPVAPPVVAAPLRDSGALIVRATALLIIAINLQPLYSLFANAQSGHISAINAIEVVGVIILAIGIFLLRELARFIYVVFAVILLVVSSVSLTKLYIDHSQTTNTASSANSQLPSNSQLIASDEATIRNSAKNTSLTPQERQRIDSAAQSQINRLKAPAVVRDTEDYISDYALIFTAIVPLIILTRPSIKTEFH